MEIKILKKNDGDKAVECFKLHNKVKNSDNIHIIIIDLKMIELNADVACKMVIYNKDRLKTK